MEFTTTKNVMENAHHPSIFLKQFQSIGFVKCLFIWSTALTILIEKQKHNTQIAVIICGCINEKKQHK